jgi:hypothetical protein
MSLPETGYDLATVTNPSSALTDFVLLVDLSLMSATFKSNWNTDDNGYGRAAIDGGPTELACDWIDLDYSAGTGLLRVKWTGTLASSGTQKLRIYPPNTGNAQYAHDDTYGSDNAYPDNCTGYYPDAGETDRTSNGNNGSSFGSPSIGGIAGMIGYATEFNGSQYITLPSSLKNINAGSILAIFKCYSLTSNKGFAVTMRTTSTDDRVYLRVYEVSDDFGMGFSDTALVITNNNNVENDGNFHTASIKWDDAGGGNSNIEAYLDGSSIGSDTVVDLAAGTAIVNIGTTINNVTYGFIGILQHVQFWDIALNSDWISEENDQCADQSTFWGTWEWQSGEPPSGVVRFGGLCGKALSGSLGGRGI